MTKAELIDRVHASFEELTRKQAGELVHAVFETIGASVRRDGRFTYPGFGTFILKKRMGRKGRNPQTGTPLTIRASRTVTFKPAPAFKEKL